MPRAIVTSFIPPTNHRGSRISVQGNASRKVFPWDDALDADENHRSAALAFGVIVLQWTDAASKEGAARMVSATLPGSNGAMVHVFP